MFLFLFDFIVYFFFIASYYSYSGNQNQTFFVGNKNSRTNNMSLLMTKKKIIRLEGLFQSESLECFSLIGQCEAILVIARSDRSEEGSFSVLLYFYTPPKPLISKLFNHNISPGLFLSRDESRPSMPSPSSPPPSSSSSPSSSTSSLSSPPLAFLFLPSLPLILTHTRTLRSRERFQETCCAFMSIDDAPYPPLRKELPDIFFHSTKKSPPHWPTSDVGH